MPINSAQKMSSIQHRISIEFRDPAHQLSTNILGQLSVEVPSSHEFYRFP